MAKMDAANGFVFISPNYFQMPTGLFKDFIDRCSIFFTAGNEEQFKSKKAIVLSVGADPAEKSDVCVDNIANNFCATIGLPVVGKKSWQTKSELKGNLNDVFESGQNPNIKSDLESLARALVA